LPAPKIPSNSPKPGGRFPSLTPNVRQHFTEAELAPTLSMGVLFRLKPFRHAHPTYMTLPHNFLDFMEVAKRLGTPDAPLHYRQLVRMPQTLQLYMPRPLSGEGSSGSSPKRTQQGRYTPERPRAGYQAVNRTMPPLVRVDLWVVMEAFRVARWEKELTALEASYMAGPMGTQPQSDMEPQSVATDFRANHLPSKEEILKSLFYMEQKEELIEYAKALLPLLHLDEEDHAIKSRSLEGIPFFKDYKTLRIERLEAQPKGFIIPKPYRPHQCITVHQALEAYARMPPMSYGFNCEDEGVEDYYRPDRDPDILPPCLGMPVWQPSPEDYPGHIIEPLKIQDVNEYPLKPAPEGAVLHSVGVVPIGQSVLAPGRPTPYNMAPTHRYWDDGEGDPEGRILHWKGVKYNKTNEDERVDDPYDPTHFAPTQKHGAITKRQTFESYLWVGAVAWLPNQKNKFRRWDNPTAVWRASHWINLVKTIAYNFSLPTYETRYEIGFVPLAAVDPTAYATGGRLFDPFLRTGEGEERYKALCTWEGYALPSGGPKRRAQGYRKHPTYPVDLFRLLFDWSPRKPDMLDFLAEPTSGKAARLGMEGHFLSAPWEWRHIQWLVDNCMAY
jgi:hypothetical protein